ncbi:MAG TPA: 4-hydroxy-3-methylbut-2-enyl diphosphate reductase [Clostridia bacterium]|nr:4-hydroxy-3-methylbut-2-enyl diphosphate reductase [Clostridia bacterium]
MKIILSKHLGFCSGVQRAVDIAANAAKEHGKAYTIGKLIHNAEALADLEKEGVYCVASIDDIPEGGYAIIGSHGAGRALYEELDKRGIPYADTTCPSVKAIHDKVRKYSDKGYFVIIVGNPAHPEVKGSLGWCKKGAVIKPKDDVLLPEDEDKIFVAAQTTIDPLEFQNCLKNITEAAKISNKSVEFFNSICYTTIARQKSAVKVANQADAVFVIGDAQSSNTKTLLGIAQNHCGKAWLVTNVTDVQSVSDKIKNITKLGIIAGASAPQRLIMEVINRMDQENKVDIVATDEVIAESEATAAEETTEQQAIIAEEAVSEEAPKTEAVEAKEEAPAKAPKAAEHPMEKVMRSIRVRPIKEGSKLKAKVISADATGISVSLVGVGKNDSGFIDRDEAELDGSYDPANYPADTELDVVVIKGADKAKGYNLSKKAYDIIKLEDEAVKKILDGEEFTLVCNQVVKGGLLGHIGSYSIFVPASQIRIGFVKNLEDYVGKKLRLRVLPPKEGEVEEEEGKRRSNPKRIVAGQRAILEEEKKAREDAFWEVMQVNNIIKGKVKRFAPFGAFVSIMNFDCLAHISDLSWTKINDPSEVLEINKSYDFVVLKADRETGRVSLGYKQLQKKPYEIAAEKYHVGDVIKGKVERIKDFGAFIEIEPGIDGLVHVSEIGHKWIASASEALKIGDEVEAKIIGFENNKITLSIKQLLAPPEAEEGTAESDKPARKSRKADGEGKKGKPHREAEDDEPREWVSASSGGATFADLFKDLDLNSFASKEEE